MIVARSTVDLRLNRGVYMNLKNMAITAVIALVAVVAYDKYRQSKG